MYWSTVLAQVLAEMQIQLQLPIDFMSLHMPQLGLFGLNISFANSGMRYAHSLKHLNASRRLSPCPTPQTLDATMWLYLPRWQYDSRPQQPVKLLQKTRTNTSKIWSILIGLKNCPSQPNSLGAPVGGSLFLQQLFIHKTSQHRLSEDGQSLTPFK